MMLSDEFVKRITDLAKLKTIYVKGGFGIVLNNAGKVRAIRAYQYNYNRRAKIAACSADTFGFDCCGIVKAVLWGFTADTSKNYGGAVYASNGVPDISEAGFLKVSRKVSMDFSGIVPGACVYMPGHMGVYIGAGRVVEATPIWTDGVQVTCCANVKRITGLHARSWDSWGLLPYVEYKEENMTREETEAMIRIMVPQILDETEKQRAQEPADAWAEDAIQRVKDAGMMVGDPDGNFRPQSSVKREELAAILAGMLPDG